MFAPSHCQCNLCITIPKRVTSKSQPLTTLLHVLYPAQGTKIQLLVKVCCVLPINISIPHTRTPCRSPSALREVADWSSEVKVYLLYLFLSHFFHRRPMLSKLEVVGHVFIVILPKVVDCASGPRDSCTHSF